MVESQELYINKIEYFFLIFFIQITTVKFVVYLSISLFFPTYAYKYILIFKPK